MKATVVWQKGMTFIGTADTGFSLPLGGSPSIGGEDDGFRPMELVATGLAGCTAMDTISILDKMREPYRQVKVSAKAQKAEDYPKKFTKIEMHYTIISKKGET